MYADTLIFRVNLQHSIKYNHELFNTKGEYEK